MSVSKREMLDKLDTAFELMLDPTFSGEKTLREWRMAYNAIRTLIEQVEEGKSWHERQKDKLRKYFDGMEE